MSWFGQNEPADVEMRDAEMTDDVPEPPDVEMGDAEEARDFREFVREQARDRAERIRANARAANTRGAPAAAPAAAAPVGACPCRNTAIPQVAAANEDDYKIQKKYYVLKCHPDKNKGCTDLAEDRFKAFYTLNQKYSAAGGRKSKKSIKRKSRKSKKSKKTIKRKSRKSKKSRKSRKSKKSRK
uniref:J domain-containing protein n=1 Tax=viral metagenome TaxID=1070528 RepID=A0A6C0HG79_9ZZZZ